jgi:hypothetical protein
MKLLREATSMLAVKTLFEAHWGEFYSRRKWRERGSAVA